MVKTIGIVSLSSGAMGEEFAEHEVKIGLKRLKEFGANVKMLPHALNGIEYIRNHPEKRAQDLLQAFQDPDIDMILCAIGGEDTYRLLPYLFDHGELRNAVSKKIFLGFSDSTMNHFMLHKVGLNSFYGQAFLPDICELDTTMLPYTEMYFRELISTGSIREIRPSDVWYEARIDFSPSAVGTPLQRHRNEGFELLQGRPRFSGQIFGGCIDTIYDMFDGTRFADSPGLCEKYHLFPELEDWKGKILLLETSEEQMSPEKYHQALLYLKDTGVFSVINGILIGKPEDEDNFEEYKALLLEDIGIPTLPIVCNINIGHALPRCIIPFGVMAHVDTEKQKISFK
ncbi:MAG: LD-carboxypeptidase [Lachnospiraceae bacterium]|uniref:LD-carboxypeptidase n=1 Tax=Candidatus Weimeria bifida TaxID=2599074 RepID=A0A6N7J0B9_9FIRM|nr:LD-carboxypeptidase [Candidatus Weimeria bifida]RRF95580.1 MAG: LD-carboxypeptidase [Lachnospiraceae bacterium]